MSNVLRKGLADDLLLHTGTDNSPITDMLLQGEMLNIEIFY